jgi:chemotaxis protein methyltransferase CheR
VARAFTRSGGLYCLGGAFRQGVEFRRQDLRAEVPDEPFHRILCRNLVCTYSEDTLRRAVLRRVLGRLIPGGFFVIGKHEALPAGLPALLGCPGRLGIYRKGEARVGGVDDPAAEALSRPGSCGASRVI